MSTASWSGLRLTLLSLLSIVISYNLSEPEGEHPQWAGVASFVVLSRECSFGQEVVEKDQEWRGRDLGEGTGSPRLFHSSFQNTERTGIICQLLSCFFKQIELIKCYFSTH